MVTKMTNEQKEKIISYVQAIEAEWKTGQVTEHTYRPMLKRLVEELVRVHLLKDESVTNPFSNPYAKFEGAGEGKVEKVTFDDGKVYINANQYFAPVPEEEWNFYIGGYQPAQKWLKDRKGRVLTSEDQHHYRAIIAALMKTAALMKEL